MAFKRCRSKALCGISSRFQLLSPTERQVPHALLTRSPLSKVPKGFTPFDLHVLGTPPAFVLSQDQTLKKLYLKPRRLQIKFLNNLLLALITQEFSLAVFRLRLNNSINCPRCFSLSLRYSIYKVQPFSLSLELIYLNTFFITCQALFSCFSKFSEVFCGPPGFLEAVHRTACI